jgi:hypothetical protein
MVPVNKIVLLVNQDIISMHHLVFNNVPQELTTTLNLLFYHVQLALHNVLHVQVLLPPTVNHVTKVCTIKSEKTVSQTNV